MRIIKLNMSKIHNIKYKDFQWEQQIEQSNWQMKITLRSTSNCQDIYYKKDSKYHNQNSLEHCMHISIQDKIE